MTLNEWFERVNEEGQSYNQYLISILLDHMYRMTEERELDAFFKEEPNVETNGIHMAFAAGLAEYCYKKTSLEPPDWIFKDKYKSKEEFHPGFYTTQDYIFYMLESLPEFFNRGLIISERDISRI